MTTVQDEIRDLKMRLIERESQMGRMEMAIRAECGAFDYFVVTQRQISHDELANVLAERLIDMEVRCKQRVQRYENMTDDKYQRKMVIWSDTLRFCQTVRMTHEQLR